MIWYSSESAMISSWIDWLWPSAKQGEGGVEMLASPKARDERIPQLGVGHGNVGLQPNDFAPLPGCHRHLCGDCFAFGQIAAEHDLLRPRRHVGQLLGIDARGPQPGKLDLQIAQKPGCVNSLSNCRAVAWGPVSLDAAAPLWILRSDPSPTAAMALSTGSSNLLPQATA